jgi:hypothetical protein
MEEEYRSVGRGFTGRCDLKFYMMVAAGPVAQGIEQQPSKLKVAGSNPAGVANKFNGLCRTPLGLAAVTW